VDDKEQTKLLQQTKKLLTAADKDQERANERYKVVGQNLQKIKDACEAQGKGYAEFLAKVKEVVGISQNRTYLLLKVGSGKTTIEAINAGTQQRMAEHRQSLRHVTQTLPSVQFPRPKEQKFLLTTKGIMPVEAIEGKSDRQLTELGLEALTRKELMKDYNPKQRPPSKFPDLAHTRIDKLTDNLTRVAFVNTTMMEEVFEALENFPEEQDSISVELLITTIDRVAQKLEEWRKKLTTKKVVKLELVK
jgi:hypothetical protein